MAQMTSTASPPGPTAAHSGEAMDRRLPEPSRWRRLLPRVLPAALVLPALALMLWQRSPRLQVVTTPQLARVIAGEFRDELMLRARVEPMRSVQLDASEAGRVEAVLAQDGDWVEAGAPLYRLHSPEQEQLLMQRSAEVAQQLANVSVQRSALVASLAQNRRELAQLQAAQLQADSDYQRIAKLASAGFVSAATLEHAQRQQQLTLQLFEQGRRDQRLEADTRRQSLDEMAQAVRGLQRGLELLEGARDRLQQRAPIAGRLSGFQLQVGSAVRLGDRLGRIDDPAGGVQLAADIDEYYLPRLQPGQTATSGSGTVTLTHTLPQVHDGKVRVLLRWAQGSAAPPNLQPGQAVDLQLQLSPPARALLLPDGPGVQTRLYVRSDKELQRRTVQLGRRAAGQVEVLAGLHPGEEVLISQPPSDADRLSLP
jgi:HlyD family secretion protein